MNKFQTKVSLLLAGLMASAVASADTIAELTTATTAAKADIVAAGALVLGVVITVASVGWIRRVIK